MDELQLHVWAINLQASGNSRIVSRRRLVGQGIRDVYKKSHWSARSVSYIFRSCRFYLQISTEKGNSSLQLLWIYPLQVKSKTKNNSLKIGMKPETLMPDLNFRYRYPVRDLYCSQLIWAIDTTDKVWRYGYLVVGIAQHQETLKWKVAAAVQCVECHACTW